MAGTVTLQTYLKNLDLMLENESPTEVVSHCRYILQHFPQNVATYRLLGKALLQKGHHEGLQEHFNEAAEVFRRVLSVLPNDYVAHVGLCEIYQQEGALDQAIWHMERAQEQDPGNGAIQDALRKLFAQRDGEENVPAKIQLTRGALAHQYVNAGLYDQALVELRSALEKTPERTDLKVLLAETLWESQHPVEAGEVAVQVLKKSPNCMAANRILAKLWLSYDRPTDAQVFLNRLEALDPYEAALVVNPDAKLGSDPNILNQLDYTARAAAQLSSETPDWVQDLGDLDTLGSLDSPFDTEEPDFAAQTPSFDEFGAQRPESPDSFSNESPNIGGAEDRFPSAGASALGDEVPDWFAENAPEVEAPGSTGWSESPDVEAIEPDWMTSDEASIGTVQPESDAEQPAPADMPDWFADVLSEETEQAEAEAPALDADWLMDSEEAEQPEEEDGISPDFAALVENPDEVLDEEPSEMEEQAPSGFTALLHGIEESRATAVLDFEVDDIEPVPPDWLAAFEEDESSPEASAEPDTIDVPTQPDVDPLAWLNDDLDAQDEELLFGSKVEDDTGEPGNWEASLAEQPEVSNVADIDWGLGETPETSFDSETAEVSEEDGDWEDVFGAEAELSDEEDQPEPLLGDAEQAEPAAWTTDDSEWLSAFEEQPAAPLDAEEPQFEEASAEDNGEEDIFGAIASEQPDEEGEAELFSDDTGQPGLAAWGEDDSEWLAAFEEQPATPLEAEESEVEEAADLLPDIEVPESEVSEVLDTVESGGDESQPEMEQAVDLDIPKTLDAGQSDFESDVVSSAESLEPTGQVERGASAEEIAKEESPSPMELEEVPAWMTEPEYDFFAAELDTQTPQGSTEIDEDKQDHQQVGETETQDESLDVLESQSEITESEDWLADFEEFDRGDLAEVQTGDQDETPETVADDSLDWLMATPDAQAAVPEEESMESDHETHETEVLNFESDEEAPPDVMEAGGALAFLHETSEDVGQSLDASEFPAEDEAETHPADLPGTQTLDWLSTQAAANDEDWLGSFAKTPTDANVAPDSDESSASIDWLPEADSEDLGADQPQEPEEFGEVNALFEEAEEFTVAEEENDELFPAVEFDESESDLIADTLENEVGTNDDTPVSGAVDSEFVSQDETPAWLSEMEPVEIPPDTQDDAESLLDEPYDPFSANIEPSAEPVTRYEARETGVLQPDEAPDWMTAFSDDEELSGPFNAEDTDVDEMDVDQGIDLSDLDLAEPAAGEVFDLDLTEQSSEELPDLELDSDALTESDTDEELSFEDDLVDVLEEDQIEAAIEPEQEGEMPGWLMAIASSEADQLDDTLFGDSEQEPVLDTLNDEQPEPEAAPAPEWLADADEQAEMDELFGEVEAAEEFDLFDEMSSEQPSDISETNAIAEQGVVPEWLAGADEQAEMNDLFGEVEAAEEFDLFGEMSSEQPSDISDMDEAAEPGVVPEWLAGADAQAEIEDLLGDLAPEMFEEDTAESIPQAGDVVAQPDDLAHTRDVEPETDEEEFVPDDFSFEELPPAWLRYPKEHNKGTRAQNATQNSTSERLDWLRDVSEDED